jgi:hypothetical protein
MFLIIGLEGRANDLEKRGYFINLFKLTRF